MGYLIFFGSMFFMVFVIFVQGWMQNQKSRLAFKQSLYDELGNMPKHKYTVENSAHISGYYQRHQEDGQLDDVTWNDLDLDSIFRRINYTHSATGEEYLYYMLRSVRYDQKALTHLEELVSWFSEHVDEQVTLQMVLSELGYTGKHSLYDYIENLDTLGKRNNLKHYVADLLFIPLLLLLPMQFTISIIGILILSIYQIVTYFKDKGQMEPYIISFAYIMRLLAVGEKVQKMDLSVCKKELENIQDSLDKMQGVKRGAFFVFASSNSRTSGNPLELLLDYLRMVFHLDIIIFNRMLKQLRTHLEETDCLITNLGYLEASVSVCRLRASLKNGFCVPDFCKDTQIRLKNGYHILLEQPVKNSITADKGVLLTGSNASGKSTFLKMVAVNAVMAQTLHTCCADAYEGNLFQIYSSMALRDSLGSGESYYIVEIKALKRILDVVKTGQPVLCFVDEVLRGTNTVERIAASTQILKSLSESGVLCFAATHDIELTDLLAETYHNYHFEEEVKNGDISFEYRLIDGKATTRNAIRLLELIGYSPEITERAMENAQKFLDSGTWQA